MIRKGNNVFTIMFIIRQSQSAYIGNNNLNSTQKNCFWGTVSFAKRVKFLQVEILH